MTTNDKWPSLPYEELGDSERRAVIRHRVNDLDEPLLLVLWRVLGLPERNVCEDLVHEAVGETG